MAVTLNVRNPRAHKLASELAERRKTGITEAVITALEHELEREREKLPLVERVKLITGSLRAKAGPNGRDVSEAERDEMWTR